MILTIALNPSVVRQIQVESLNIENMNESIIDQLTIGDCGIYSAYILKVMQVDPYVMGISGGIGGRFVKNFLDRNRIKTDFLQVDHELKSHLLITDVSKNTTTTIVSHSNSLSQKDFVNIKHKLNHHLSEAQIVAISGEDSYMPGILDDIHAMSKDAKMLIVNASGYIAKEVFKRRIYAGLINQQDLGEIGIDFEMTEECFDRIRQFQKQQHIRYFIVMTQDQIIGFTKNKICMVSYQLKEGIYPISNSAIFGGLIVGVRRNYPFERMMKLMGSLAHNCSLTDYPFIVRRQEINQGINTIKINEVYNTRNGYRLSDVER